MFAIMLKARSQCMSYSISHGNKLVCPLPFCASKKFKYSTTCKFIGIMYNYLTNKVPIWLGYTQGNDNND